MFETLFENGKLRKGKALHVGIISILTVALSTLLYTVGAYATTKLEKLEENVSTMESRLSVAESAKPLTLKELNTELKEYSAAQQKLYEGLATQTQNTTELVVKAYAESFSAIVSNSLDQQEKLSNRVDAQFEKASKLNLDLSNQIESIRYVTEKDREAFKILQENLNTVLYENAEKQKLLEQKLNIIIKSLEK